MPGEEPTPKLFSPEEANRLLPQVKVLLTQLRTCRDSVVKMEEKKAVEEISWLQPDGSVSPKSRTEIGRLEKLQREEAKVFEQQILKLDKLGVQLKDLDQGLVDFFTTYEDRLVYLCWKEGEDRIRFWHDLETGFAGRRPIEELEKGTR